MIDDTDAQTASKFFYTCVEYQPYMDLRVVSSVLFGLFAIIAYYVLNARHENRELKRKLQRMTQLRLEERKGRTNAERLLRNNVSQHNADHELPISSLVKYIQLRRIGTFHSPFNDRRGTPRQGVLVPSAIGYIEFDSWIQPQSTLDGLVENFSHIWVIWQFHQNTNSIQQHHVLNADNHRNNNNNNNLATSLGCKAKIKPPRLHGKKIGIFACRTPHRPNPVGLTKCKIIRMDYKLNRLYLSDIDMINGTPIIDIKPYVAYSDIQQNAIVPEWCTVDSLLFQEVIWNERDRESMMQVLEQSAYYSEYFEDLDAFKSMFEEILIRDIRSLHQRKNASELFECKICDVLLKYRVSDKSKTVNIVSVQLENPEDSNSA